MFSCPEIGAYLKIDSIYDLQIVWRIDLQHVLLFQTSESV